MKIKLLVPIGALKADAGDVVDVTPFLAEAWIARGHAEKVGRRPDPAEIKAKDAKGAEVAVAVVDVETRAEPEPEPEPAEEKKPRKARGKDTQEDKSK